jgi:hypothetical protein
MTIFFLLSSYVKPGYVEQTLDMIEMLKIGNDKNIDLDYNSSVEEIAAVLLGEKDVTLEIGD